MCVRCALFCVNSPTSPDKRQLPFLARLPADLLERNRGGWGLSLKMHGYREHIPFFRNTMSGIHTLSGETSQKKRKTPTNKPPAALFGSFYPKKPRKTGQGCLAGWLLARARHPPELLRRKSAGRQKSTAVELLLHAAGHRCGGQGGNRKRGGRESRRSERGETPTAQRASRSRREVLKRAQGTPPRSRKRPREGGRLVRGNPDGEGAGPRKEE